MDESWATLWEAVGDAMPDAVAVVQGDRRLRWSDVDQRASRLASALIELDVGRDTTVGILAYNVPEHLEAVFAAYKLRACPINLNFRYRHDELAQVLGDSDTAVLIYHGSLAGDVAAARTKAPRLRGAIQIDDATPMLGGALDYEELVATHLPVPRQSRSGEDIQLLYTGGTTGRPRGVMYHHRDAVAMNAFAAYSLAGLHVPDSAEEAAHCAGELQRRGLTPVVLPASPLAHGTALNLAAAAWLLGGTVVFLEQRSFDPHELWQTVQREAVSEIGIVGDAFALPMVAALEEAERAGCPYDLSSVRRILSSGAPWSLEAKRAIAARGSMTLVETIGASEGGPTAVAIMAPGERDTRFVLGERACLLDNDGNELPPGSGSVGMLAMKPPIPHGYYKDPDRSAQVFRTINGRQYSIAGDLARILADGSVQFLGRGSLCINTGGEKVFPEEVEAVVREHPAVIDVNVVGISDVRWNERVCAVVACRPGFEIPEDELQEHVRSRLAGYKVPRQVVFVEAIPRTPTGKARYEWARATVAAGSARPIDEL